MTALYGLIGYPLSHSFSAGFFNRKFADEGTDAEYLTFPIASITEFPGLLQNNTGLRGLNVTIPYKEAVIACLNDVDNVAAQIGAVNCITIRQGRLKGYNTDVIGFEKSLLPLLQPQHNAALVLGTGGASKAVTFVLRKLGIPYQCVSRSGAEHVITYSELTPDIISSHRLIINTTPLGMFPDVSNSPAIPYSALTTDHLLFDLVYNPAETLFLLNGRATGATTKNGLEMLELQALAAWEIWNNA